jgi:glycosyltransferase involved in cell wall biosynthesis
MSKIAFVTDTMHPGGSERVISVLANEMTRRGLYIEIICLRGKESFYTLERRVKTIFMEQVLKQQSMYNKVRFLRTYVKEENIDIVIPFMTPVFCFTLFSLLGAGKTIICSERIDPTKTSKVRKLLRAILLPTTSYLVVQTEQIKKYYSNSIQKRCSVIYNPVSDSFFEEKQIVPKNRFMSVGRLAPQKNQRMLIDAFSHVHQKYPDYSLSIFGDGPLKEELQSYIDSKGLQDVVRLEGTSSDISKELHSSFAFCLTSDFEGMSNAMIEALCSGIPLISTNVSGAAELLGNNEGGMIVPIRDTDAFASAMLKLIESPSLVERMRNYNLKKREEFRTSQIVDKWIEIINSFS